MPTVNSHNGASHNGAGPSSREPAAQENGAAGAPPVRKGGPFDLGEIERVANEMFRAMPGAVLPRLDDEPPKPLQPPVPLEPPQPPVPLAPPEPGPFTLSGDPIPLDELGLAGRPRGETEDPLAARHYLIDESASSAPAAGISPAPPPAPHVGLQSAHPGLDVEHARAQFPLLAETVHGHPLVWLDNGATTQKPQVVIDRLAEFYRHENSNIHRGAHTLAARATDAYEHARDVTGRFLHAGSPSEIVFLRGATEAINLVAQSWGRANVGPGDEIVITWLEHHANIVPWQQLCQATGARLCVVPVDDRGQVQIDEYERRLSDRTRLVAVSHVSNALGTITPVREMTELAHRYGARVLVDGAQAVSHMPVDVQMLDSDWYAFSGHKVFGPTGIGVLYGKRDLLDAMPPWQGGGNMIRDVTFEHTEYQTAPNRFEAGTTSIADAVALGAALDYVQRLGLENVARYERDLLRYATEALMTIPGLELIGTAPEKAAILSFILSGLPPEEVAAELDHEGIAVRAGHHCAQPIIRRFGHEGTVRASLALYNTCADVDALTGALRRIATRSGAGPALWSG